MDKHRVYLFYKEMDGATIEELIFFRDDMLVFDGYHCGDRVEEVWGDWDYEFWINIPMHAVPLLKKKLWVSWLPNRWLPLFLTMVFPGDTGFKEVRDFLEKHNIEHEYFIWV